MLEQQKQDREALREEKKTKKGQGKIKKLNKRKENLKGNCKIS